MSATRPDNSDGAGFHRPPTPALLRKDTAKAAHGPGETTMGQMPAAARDQSTSAHRMDGLRGQATNGLLSLVSIIHLIAESVLIAEAYRERLLAERGIPPEEAPPFRPLGRESDPWVPIEPVLDVSYGILPPAPEPTMTLTVLPP